ncbi:MAG TPA: nuclear transport factor 2 family protein [Solirubrobacteraceae bacterium]
MAESNAALAHRGFTAALNGDVDTVAEMLDPEVRWHGGDPNARGACRNRDDALRVIRAAVAAGRIGELVEVHDAGDQVVVLLRPASGGLVANLTTFRNGRAVEMVHYPNPDDALRAAGLQARES